MVHCDLSQEVTQSRQAGYGRLVDCKGLVYAASSDGPHLEFISHPCLTLARRQNNLTYCPAIEIYTTASTSVGKCCSPERLTPFQLYSHWCQDVDVFLLV